MESSHVPMLDAAALRFIHDQVFLHQLSRHPLRCAHALQAAGPDRRRSLTRTLRAQCAPANPDWRQASYTAMAAAFARLRLRLPASMGSDSTFSGAIDASTSGGRPRRSEPNNRRPPPRSGHPRAGGHCRFRWRTSVRAAPRAPPRNSRARAPWPFRRSRVPPGARTCDPAESQGLDQVQLTAGIGGEPDEIARVRRNLRLEDHDVKHRGAHQSCSLKAMRMLASP